MFVKNPIRTPACFKDVRALSASGYASRWR
jgi:hypothetical protein